MVSASIAPSNILGVTWSLTTNNMPLGSLAVLTNSPLGTNVPLFKTGDRVTGGASGTPTPYLQLAGRPDLFPPGCRRTIHCSGHDHHDGRTTGRTPSPRPRRTSPRPSRRPLIYGVNTCEACHSGGRSAKCAQHLPHSGRIRPMPRSSPVAIDGQVSSHYSTKLHSVPHAWL